MVSVVLLRQQSAETSSALIEHYKESSAFTKLSRYEGTLTQQRDQDDADKLQAGIDFAKAKNVIDPDFQAEPYIAIDVLGKTPAEVASTILESVGDLDHGTVIVLVGLSGTGKGTTVDCLRERLTTANKNVVTWSNGNIFRSVTLLAATWCEQQDMDFNIELAMSTANLEAFMKMLSFDKFESGQYDTRIQGLGLDMYVSQVQNTELKAPKVSRNIPAVAEYTQGEVILFAAQAVQTLKDAGYVVLLEGREQTVNYVRTPHRFTLTLSDDTLIGKRRAAQRLMAAAVKEVGDETAFEDQVTTALDQTLEAMVKEIE